MGCMNLCLHGRYQLFNLHKSCTAGHCKGRTCALGSPPCDTPSVHLRGHVPARNRYVSVQTDAWPQAHSAGIHSGDEAEMDRKAIPMTVQEYVARQTERMGEALAHFIGSTEEDRLNWQPPSEGSQPCRSAYHQIGECVQVNRRFATML